MIFARFELHPWIGLVLPEDDVGATIRRTFLKDVTLEELVECLALSEEQFGRHITYTGEEQCQLLAGALGLREQQ